MNSLCWLPAHSWRERKPLWRSCSASPPPPPWGRPRGSPQSRSSSPPAECEAGESDEGQEWERELPESWLAARSRYLGWAVWGWPQNRFSQLSGCYFRSTPLSLVFSQSHVSCSKLGNLHSSHFLSRKIVSTVSPSSPAAPPALWHLTASCKITKFDRFQK